MKNRDARFLGVEKQPRDDICPHRRRLERQNGICSIPASSETFLYRTRISTSYSGGRLLALGKGEKELFGKVFFRGRPCHGLMQRPRGASDPGVPRKKRTGGGLRNFEEGKGRKDQLPSVE